MNTTCSEFRRRLEEALLGRPSPEELGTLEWHEHLAACNACRGLLELEQALEELLATLPEPRLEPDLARRVLERLRAAEESPADLDALLDLDVEEPTPQALPERILGDLSDARADLRLDALLDRVPEPEIPADLAKRTLGALSEHRAGRSLQRAGRQPAAIIAGESPCLPEVDDRARPFFGERSLWLAAAAAVLIGAFAGWMVLRREPVVPVQPLAKVESPVDPDDELLAVLDVLEAWDVLVEDDLDLFLASYATSDEFLLDWDTDDLEEGDDSGEDSETNEAEEG